jgi:hypothetical protein
MSAAAVSVSTVTTGALPARRPIGAPAVKWTSLETMTASGVFVDPGWQVAWVDAHADLEGHTKYIRQVFRGEVTDG